MNIDFVEPRLPSRRLWVIAAIPWVLALILGCLFIVLRARVEQEQALLAAEAAARSVPVVAPAPRTPPPYQDDAIAALKRAALPEADALAELENVAVVGIQLRSIDVNPQASVVTVELDASSDDALGDYLDQLNAGMPMQRWHIKEITALTGLSSANAGGGNSVSAGHSAVIAREL